MEKEKVYFEENNIIIEKKKKIRKYPIAKLRYKRNTFVYKNPAFAPADGRRKEEFLVNCRFVLLSSAPFLVP